LTTHGGRLPAETSRFFGRSHEAAAIQDALARSRLVTLTGPGGIGKTRLAIVREQGAALSAGAAEDTGRWKLLTSREREVATLVATGLTNKDIAARLVVSKRTVDAHLEHILSKLGYSSRTQVAALASHEQARAQRPDPDFPVPAPGSGNVPGAAT
jgi:DNA-binding NarL/FixJ family response regulator